MIRRFILTVLVLALTGGCGYYWWQASTLTSQVHDLKTQVVSLKSKVHTLESHRGSRTSHAEASTATGSAKTPTDPAGWLAAGNEHFDKFHESVNRAQTEYAAAMDAYHHAVATPMQATQNGLTEARQKISTLETDMGDMVHRVKSAVSQ